MKKFYVLIIQLILSIAVIGGAIAIGAKIIKERKVAQREEVKAVAPVVEVIRIQKKTVPSLIKATGTVSPSREIVVKPQVSGEIVWISPKCVPGRFVEKGEVLYKIDSQQYELTVENQKGQVAKAVYELELEKGRQIVAKREWQLVGSKNKGLAPEDLALRKPHLANAEAALKSSRSSLERAELDVKRCEIRAPFNGVVQEKYSDYGQIVSATSNLIKLVSRETFWVYTNVPVSSLDKLPRLKDQAKNCGDYCGVKAWVIESVGRKKIRREAQVLNLLPDLQEDGRLARLLVEVKKPLESTEKPLLLHSYVTVEIEAMPWPDSFLVPRRAIREGDRVWIVNSDNALEFKEVNIAWREEAAVVVNEGISDNDAIITSLITSPVPGMKLRIRELDND